MEKLSLLSEAEIRHWFSALEAVHYQLLNSEIPLSKDQLMTETEVGALLGVTERTMRRYRSKKYLHYVKLDGRIFYLRMLLYIDLLLKGQNSVGEPRVKNQEARF